MFTGTDTMNEMYLGGVVHMYIIGILVCTCTWYNRSFNKLVCCGVSGVLELSIS